MRKRRRIGSSLALSAIAFVPPAFADSEFPHAGQMDTDGILSRGEYRNPNIDYDRSQRIHERDGDSRVNNPDNDDAARDDRRYQNNWRSQRWERDRDFEDRGERGWRERREEDRSRNEKRKSSWWPF